MNISLPNDEDNQEEGRDISVGRGISFKISLLKRIGQFVNIKQTGRLSQFVQEACEEKLGVLERDSLDSRKDIK